MASPSNRRPSFHRVFNDYYLSLSDGDPSDDNISFDQIVVTMRKEKVNIDPYLSFGRRLSMAIAKRRPIVFDEFAALQKDHA